MESEQAKEISEFVLRLPFVTKVRVHGTHHVPDMPEVVEMVQVAGKTDYDVEVFCDGGKLYTFVGEVK